MQFFLVIFIFCCGLMSMEKYQPICDLAANLRLNEHDSSNLISAVSNIFGDDTSELFELLLTIDNKESRRKINELSKVKAKSRIKRPSDSFLRLADCLEIEAALKSYEQR